MKTLWITYDPAKPGERWIPWTRPEAAANALKRNPKLRLVIREQWANDTEADRETFVKKFGG